MYIYLIYTDHYNIIAKYIAGITQRVHRCPRRPARNFRTTVTRAPTILTAGPPGPVITS